MEKTKNKRRFTLLDAVIILAVLLAASLAVLSSATGQTVFDIAVQAVMAPIKAGANALTNQAENIYDYMFRYEALKAENEALREEIAKMREDSNKADSVIRENERLRDLLELKQAQEDFQLVDILLQ